ncbi:hypothetical protein [Selenomonas ruminantium]|nr:hypothetical protein [Selenomonas ruminantium]
MKKGKVMYCLGVVGACFVVGIGSYGIGHARVIPGKLLQHDQHILCR